jgi:hypothetical protein
VVTEALPNIGRWQCSDGDDTICTAMGDLKGVEGERGGRGGSDGRGER